jgi:N-methylhydantoinase B
MSVVSGIDPRTGKAFVNQVLLGFSGGPASPSADAWQTLMHVGAAGMCFIDGIELDELRQPIVVHTRRFEIDTEGPGRRRGASSLLVEFGPLNCDLDIVYASDGTENAAKGVRGGREGAPAIQNALRSGATAAALPICARVQIADGDVVHSRSAGGAGYGSPLDREPELVSADVAEAWISRERAATVYGVIIDERGDVDRAGTEAARKRLRKKG